MNLKTAPLPCIAPGREAICPPLSFTLEGIRHVAIDASTRLKVGGWFFMALIHMCQGIHGLNARCG